ncbi:MAG: hypothetical protein ACREQ7_17075 [Candidatus Binatia bacterium]
MNQFAKKKSHEEEIRRGLDTLRKLGVPVDDVSPDLTTRLVQELGRERETDLAVVFALGKVGAASAAEALIGLESRTKDKEIKKEIRRSLFKLSQKGIALPEEKKPHTPAPILTSGPEIEAYMSVVDGSGGRLVWIAKPQAGHGLRVIQGMVSDREGLLRIAAVQVRRKELRNMAQGIKESHNISMISVPWEYADEVLYSAYEKAKALGRGGVEQFHEIRSIVETGKPKSQKHPIYQRLEAESLREGPWREQSRRLLDEPELRFWFVDEDLIRSYLPQLEEAQTSRLVLNPMQKEERFAGIVREAVKACCSGDMGTILGRRMEDMALYFLETNREPSARLSLAVALQIREGDPGPLDISFLTGLVQKSFGFYLSQEQKKPDEGPSLIVKP